MSSRFFYANGDGTWNFGSPTGVQPRDGYFSGALSAASMSADVLKSVPKTVSGLPTPASAGAGARAFVTDATVTLAAGLGTAVAGGGANKVPVYSDGASWRIGG